MEPSTTSTNGSSLPCSARYQYFRKSSPFSYARTGLCKCTRGSPGIAPSSTSSMLGCVAAVTDTESPSQPNPAVIHRICTSATGDAFCVTRPYGTVSPAIHFSFPAVTFEDRIWDALLLLEAKHTVQMPGPTVALVFENV